MNSVLGYATTFFLGGSYRQPPLPEFGAEIVRFHATLSELARLVVATEEWTAITPQQLLQGPLADAMTHAGQLAMLRRLAGNPVAPENFVFARIDAENLGPEQAPPARPDALWPEGPETMPRVSAAGFGTLRLGATGEASVVVSRELTVRHFHPEMPEAYGTPFMIYLMERAAGEAIHPHLPAGWVTVGVEVNVRHLAATPVGRTVTARATVTSVAGRLIGLDVEAHDGVRLIGQGAHTRAPVELAKFESNLRR
jgi:predicted thioesterase